MLLKYLYTILKPIIDIGPKPWLKGNSEVIAVSISDLQFDVKDMGYLSTYEEENITVGIADIVFTVTTV